MKTRGSCLCGAVRFEGTPSADGMRVCHCKMCRVQSSGPLFAARFEEGVTLTEERGLKWYDASDVAERGFCTECGSTLFWRLKSATPGDWAVSAGTLPDDAVGAIAEHVWAEERPAYYTFADDSPRRTATESLRGLAPPKPHGDAR